MTCPGRGWGWGAKEERRSSQHGAEFGHGSEKSGALFGVEGMKGRWLGNRSSRRTAALNAKLYYAKVGPSNGGW